MDTVFYNGVIHTMAGRTVSALAVQNGRIALVGTDEAALALADAHTKKIDLGGRCVLPGFTDSHMHILQAGGSSAMALTTTVSIPLPCPTGPRRKPFPPTFR